MAAPVTVLMPNYNNEAFLREAIDSILHQTFKDFIFLIVDDGSTDKSIDIINSYTDPRIRLVIKEKNSGIVDALNKGIDLVDTKYFVRMDGDDLSTPDRIQLLYDFMEAHPEVGVCGSHLRLFGDQNEVWKMELDPQRIKSKLIYTNSVSHAPSIFRTEVLKKNKIYYTNNHPYMEDYDIFFRLKNLTEFAHLDKVLYDYRVLKHNSTVKNRHTILQRKRNMYVQVLSELGIEPSERNIDLHVQLFLGDIPLTYSTREYREWVNTLLRQNEKMKLYPQQGFKSFMDKTWRGFFFKLVPLPVSKTIGYFIVSKKATYAQVLYLAKVKFNKLIGR